MRLAALTILASACAAHAPRNPQAPPPFSAAARIVDGELDSEQDYGYEVSGYPLSDRYLASWDVAGPVRFAIRAKNAIIYLSGSGEVKGADGTFPVAAAEKVKCWVGSGNRQD